MTRKTNVPDAKSKKTCAPQVRTLGELVEAVRAGSTVLRFSVDQFRAFQVIRSHCKLEQTPGVTVENLERLLARISTRHTLTWPQVKLLTLADGWVAHQVPPIESRPNHWDNLAEQCRSAEKRINLYADLRSFNGVRAVAEAVWECARKTCQSDIPPLALPGMATDIPAKDAIEGLRMQALQAVARLMEWARPKSKQSSDDADWISLADAERLVEINRGTIYRAVERGELASRGQNRDRRVHVGGLVGWKLERAAKPEPKESDERVEMLVKTHVTGYRK